MHSRRLSRARTPYVLRELHCLLPPLNALLHAHIQTHIRICVQPVRVHVHARALNQNTHAHAHACSFDGSETVEICTDGQSTDDCTAVASVDVWAHSAKFVMPSDQKSGPRWLHIKSATGGGAATVTPINTPDVRCNAVECSMLHGAHRPSLACWAPRSFHAPSHLSLFMAPTHCVSYVDCVGEPFLPHWPTRAGHGRLNPPSHN